MNTEVVLVNYRIPVPLKEQFEVACKQMHMPMTSQINVLIREFVNRQKQYRDEPNDLDDPISFYSGMDDAL